MTFFRLAIALAIVASGPSQEAFPSPAARVKYRDSLRQCVSIQLGPVHFVENVALFEATLYVSRTVARCGCASSGLRYESFLPYPEGARDVLARGRLETKSRLGERVPIMLVGASDTGQVDLAKVSIELECEVPRSKNASSD